MTISIRLNEQDEQLFRNYAKIHDISLSEMVRRAVIEQIEDEIDLKAYREAMAEYEADPVTYSHEEIVKMLEEEE